MPFDRRNFLRSLSRTALVLPFADILSLAAPQQQDTPKGGTRQSIGPTERSYDAKPAPPPPGPKSPIEGTPLGVSFVDVVKGSGLDIETIYGGVGKNKYLLETTGCGLAFYDYDNDGWLDVFLVNGWRLEGFAKGQEPHCHLFKNNRDGTFTDVTKGSGLELRTGWGQACCVGDYDNDGNEDLFVTYYGQNALYRNNGNGTFTDVTERAGLIQPGPKTRWNTGCTWVDYDRDGHLDLFVANYVDFDLKTAPLPEEGPCTYKGIVVACGPPGLPGGKNILYHNNGDGTFMDVSQKSGMWNAVGTYGLSVAASDLDNDGWPDIYVANDSAPATLYLNQKDGTFKDVAIENGAALSAEAKPQAGMGVSIGDYNRDGNLDVVKTNFAGDTDSLYTNLGDGVFEDRTYPSGLGVNTRLLGWGVGFFDMDNDGWLDIFVANGHVYPQADSIKTAGKYRQPFLLHRNHRDGTFDEVSKEAGLRALPMHSSRGAAFGDLFNDGNVDVVVLNVGETPSLLRNENHDGNHRVLFRLIGTKSNRAAIGARVTIHSGGTMQFTEVRGGGSYLSQNDLRLHFGLAHATNIDSLEIRWPSGPVENVEKFRNLKPDAIYTIVEGQGIRESRPLPAP